MTKLQYTRSPTGWDLLAAEGGDFSSLGAPHSLANQSVVPGPEAPASRGSLLAMPTSDSLNGNLHFSKIPRHTFKVEKS